MGATTTAPMTVTAARQLLRDTSNVPTERVDEAQRAVGAFYDAKPVARACLACRCMIWSEHTTDGNAVWACSNCHRSSTLTAEEWHAQQQAAEAVRKVTAAREAAAVPEPHKVLKEALAKLTEARKALSHIDGVLPASREALVAAQLKHDGAQAAAASAAEQAAVHLADSIAGRRMAGPAPSIAATRAALATSVDGLVAAKNARTILDSRRTDARAAVTTAEAAARRAAVRVLAAETLEDLIETASVARATYIDAVAALGWLIRNGAIPNGDVRPNQLVREGDTPPSTWREAQHADGGLGERLNALLGPAPSAGRHHGCHRNGSQ